MAAQYWLGTLILELGIAAAIVWPLTTISTNGLGVLIAMWVCLFLIVQVVIVTLAFVLTRWTAGVTLSPLRLRTVAAESAALLRAAVTMSVHSTVRPCHRGALTVLHGPSISGRTPPVLLIHGVLCNGAVWSVLERRLAAAGCTDVCHIDLHPPFADIEAHAADVSGLLVEMQRRHNGERILIIGHSMGGLVARAALRNVGSSVIRCILTLGTPHHGTAIACHIPLIPMRQMCPHSPWLHRLNTEQENRLSIPMVSLYSIEDTLLAPACSAVLAGARNIELDGLGHLSLLVCERALEHVITEVQREAQQ